MTLHIMNNRKILLVLMLVVAVLTAGAQGRKNMRINEVMIAPDSTCQGSGWVELFNSSYGSNAIEKMFVTTLKPEEIFTDLVKGKDRDVVLRALCESHPKQCYMVPRGDERNTKIAPRTHVVFSADGKPETGTFHLPFVFTSGQENYVALYDANGDLVDEVTVPDTLALGHTWAIAEEGRLPKPCKDFTDSWQSRDGKTIATAITPGNYNTREFNENIGKFHEHDSHGFILTVSAMSIVFSALILLYLCFKVFGKLSRGQEAEEKPAVQPAPLAADLKDSPTADTADEEMAAICLALYQHLNAHDQESGVLTFARDGLGAWGNKAGLLRKLPERK